MLLLFASPIPYALYVPRSSFNAMPTFPCVLSRFCCPLLPASTQTHRFEEPNSHRLQSFPRVIADSVRRPDERRKRQREAKAARQQADKEAREAEIRRLKNLKKQEIQDM